MEYGLIGEHLSHSYSRQIHALLGGYDYQIVSLPLEELEGFFRRREFRGLNVTIPYKKAVIAYCPAISDTAAKIGSVNTIVSAADGSLYGDNTDYYGFAYMAKRAGIGFAGKKVLVLGSGGTGATAEAVAADAGAREVIVVSRTGKVNYGNIGEQADADIIVNATPVGMYPATEQFPVDLTLFPRCAGVLDVTYNPLRTRLLQQAAERGIPGANGLSMLAAQAKKASELFTGAALPEEKIESIVKELTLEMSNIVLVGMPGSGKTTVGKLLAEKTRKAFVDTDKLVEREAGMAIPELFERFGEERFREIEADAVAKVGKEKGQVIATGGGAVLSRENRLNLKQNGFVVFLERGLGELEREGRPLSAGDGALAKLYETRLPLYREICDMEIRNDGTAEEAADTVSEVFYETACD